MKSIIITWYDAYSVEAWNSRVAIDEELKKQPKGAITYSQGFLYTETDTTVVICQSHQPFQEETAAGLLIIPRAMIENIEVIKE